MVACGSCKQPWATASAAETCEEQDALERYDREHDRLLRINQEAPR